MADLSTIQALIARGKARSPELSSRLERALVIVFFRTMEHLPTGQWVIAGGHNESYYTVAAGGTDCTCPDAAQRAPRGLCKHRLAVMLVERAEQELTAREAAETAALLAHFAPAGGSHARPAAMAAD